MGSSHSTAAPAATKPPQTVWFGLVTRKNAVTIRYFVRNYLCCLFATSSEELAKRYFRKTYDVLTIAIDNYTEQESVANDLLSKLFEKKYNVQQDAIELARRMKAGEPLNSARMDDLEQRAQSIAKSIASAKRTLRTKEAVRRVFQENRDTIERMVMNADYKAHLKAAAGFMEELGMDEPFSDEEAKRYSTTDQSVFENLKKLNLAMEKQIEEESQRIYSSNDPDCNPDLIYASTFESIPELQGSLLRKRLLQTKKSAFDPYEIEMEKKAVKAEMRITDKQFNNGLRKMRIEKKLAQQEKRLAAEKKQRMLAVKKAPEERKDLIQLPEPRFVVEDEEEKKEDEEAQSEIVQFDAAMNTEEEEDDEFDSQLDDSSMREVSLTLVQSEATAPIGAI